MYFLQTAQLNLLVCVQNPVESQVFGLEVSEGGGQLQEVYQSPEECVSFC